MEKQPKTILVVDDELLNIKMVKAHLLPAGYSVLEATNGFEALRLAEKIPDLILLDIMMPGMDGFETCMKLKKQPITSEIPVIFLSALHDPKIKARGFEKGGVDYISKPFDPNELLARLKTHLIIREQDIQLKNYAAKLEEMVEARTRQLIHADRLATLGTFASTIVHEINNPNTLILGNLELLKVFWDSAKDIVQRHADEDETGVVRYHLQIVNEILDGIEEGSLRITKATNSLRSYAKRGGSEKLRCKLIHPIEDALRLTQHRLRRGVAIELGVPEEIQLVCDRQNICQVFVNLINNASDAMGNDGKGKITITAHKQEHFIFISVKDNGPGIPDAMSDSVFEPFYTTKQKTDGTGLGLFIVRGIIEEHDGEISLEQNSPEGAQFNIVLPLN